MLMHSIIRYRSSSSPCVGKLRVVLPAWCSVGLWIIIIINDDDMSKVSHARNIGKKGALVVASIVHITSFTYGGKLDAADGLLACTDERRRRRKGVKNVSKIKKKLCKGKNNWTSRVLFLRNKWIVSLVYDDDDDFVTLGLLIILNRHRSW